MIILGKHKQSFALIRSLAITCHSLDVAAHRLFANSTYSGKTNRVRETYDQMLSTSLLHLAVAIRTNIYQNPAININTEDYITHCGFLDITKTDELENVGFSIKDVCDKIIHANTIEREIEPLDVNTGLETITIINGSHGKANWQLSISINLFCEAILNWLDEIET